MDNAALIAIKKGNLSQLKNRLNQGININAQDTKHRTLLHHAVSNNKYDIVEYLLQKGADVLLTTEKNNTALHIAVANSNEAMTYLILTDLARDKLRKLIDIRTKANGMTALHFAAKRDSYAIVFILLEYGANFEVTNTSGEKAVDLSTRNSVRQLLRQIESSFTKAKAGDQRLINDLENCNQFDLTSALNCRNNSGYTLMQVVVREQHHDLASSLLWLRINQLFQREPDGIHELKRRNEVDKLAEKAEECREFWTKQWKDFEALDKSMSKKKYIIHAGRLSCLGLKKAHEFLMEYRKFDGSVKSTVDVKMKTIEETFEAFEIDLEHLSLNKGKIAGSYEMLPFEFKEAISSLLPILDRVVYSSITYFVHWINSIRVFHVVKDDDLEKVQQLIASDKELSVDGFDRVNCRTPLGYAAEKGSKKMVKLLLKSGAEMKHELAVSPVYLAVSNGHAKITKVLLKNVATEELNEVVDCRRGTDSTALHVAAMNGRLDIVKILLRFGATYGITDDDDETPLDLSSSEKVSGFLRLVDECFKDAKEANVELIHKLKMMETREFLAVAGARNDGGQTLDAVAAKSGAKSVAGMILRMIREAKKK